MNLLDVKVLMGSPDVMESEFSYWCIHRILGVLSQL